MSKNENPIGFSRGSVNWEEGNFCGAENLPYQVGDRIYLAEEWTCDFLERVGLVTKTRSWVESTFAPSEIGFVEWESPRTMPPEAAQYWFEVTGVRGVLMGDTSLYRAIESGLARDDIFDGSDGASERFWYMAKENWNAAYPEHPWTGDRWVVVLEVMETENAEKST